MPDTIGRITVPTPTPSGLVFALPSGVNTDFPAGESQDLPIIEHRFGELATQSIQRFQVGIGPRRFIVSRGRLTSADRQYLIDFFTQINGGLSSFTYNVPFPDGSFQPVVVVWESAPLTITDLVNASSFIATFVEAPDLAPTAGPYTSTNVVPRYPDAVMTAALLQDVQQIIPLIHIKALDSSVPDIYLSDRRVNVDGNLYLARLLNMGEPGSDVILSQDISGKSDNVRFNFGNADRAMSLLSKDTSLKYGSIDLSLYHLQSGYTLQLWKGIIISYTRDGSPVFSMTCSDGLYPLMQMYPRRTITRQCWKPFNAELVPGSGFKPCPFDTASTGGPGDPSSCDYFFDTANGCLAHGMSPYFGGHPEFPQSVVIKDNGTGIIGGFLRSTVTSTSIASDSMYGQPLTEIWCNSDGDPLKSFVANCIVVAVRDESTYEDVLGIVGAGPIAQFGVDDPRPGGPVTAVTAANNFNFLIPISPIAAIFLDAFAENTPGIPIPPGEGGIVATTADGYNVLIAPLADNLPCQGFKVDLAHPGQQSDPTKNSDLGLRQVHGEDPVLQTQPFVGGKQYAAGAFSLGQGTPQHWDVPNPPYSGGGGFSNIDTGAANNIIPLAAGTAIVEIRYSKSAGNGIIPTTAESHSMTVPIAQGLSGLADFGGTIRSGLTDPFWIAVNTYLRALALDNAPLATQIKYFVPESLNAPDGVSGTSDIANRQVAPLVGDPTVLETQFRFQGVISEFKPFRDWLTEILNCCLGYFSFDFGRLNLGIRENAGSVSTFGLGNMLFQSLSLTPAEAAFEYLKISFANRDLQYQQDLVEYQDKDHAIYLGRAGAPLTAKMRSVGLSTISQGLRIAATRVREEIGGILRPDQPNKYIEWENNDVATFKTTILALQVGVGQVISITHPDVQTYPGPPPGAQNVPTSFVLQPNTWNYRVQRITLHKDWSITIQAKSVTDSMYSLDVGPKPADALVAPLPSLFYAQPLVEWGPFQELAPPDDAAYPGEYTYAAQEGYVVLADGAQALLTLSGKVPVDSFIPGCGSPLIERGSIVINPTGGFLPGGQTIRICVCAFDPNQNCSPPSNIVTVQLPPGPNTYSITIKNIEWPLYANLQTYVMFYSTDDDLIGAQETFHPLTATGGTPVFSPTSVTITGPIVRQNWSLPSSRYRKIRCKVKRLFHGGVVGGEVQAINGNVIISSDTVDVTGKDDWTGRVLFITGRNNAPTPYRSYRITGFLALQGYIILDPTHTALSDIQVGDVFFIGTLGQDNSANPRVVTDPGLSNGVNYIKLPNGGIQLTPHSGLTPNDPAEVGTILRVIAGTNRGKFANVIANGNISYTIDADIFMDATSIWTIEEKGWSFSVDTSIGHNYNSQFVTNIAVPTANYQGGSVIMTGVLVDVDGNESSEVDAPFRMMYVFGQPPTLVDTGITSCNLPDDTGGAGASVYYGNSHAAGEGFEGSISTSGPNGSQDLILDFLFADPLGGAVLSQDANPGDQNLVLTSNFSTPIPAPFYVIIGTEKILITAINTNGTIWTCSPLGSIHHAGDLLWVSIFNDLTKPTFKTTDNTIIDLPPALFNFNPMGKFYAYRVDVLQAGGWTNINFVVRWGLPPGSSTGAPGTGGSVTTLPNANSTG